MKYIITWFIIKIITYPCPPKNDISKNPQPATFGCTVTQFVKKDTVISNRGKAVSFFNRKNMEWVKDGMKGDKPKMDSITTK